MHIPAGDKFGIFDQGGIVFGSCTKERRHPCLKFFWSLIRFYLFISHVQAPTLKTFRLAANDLTKQC